MRRVLFVVVAVLTFATCKKVEARDAVTGSWNGVVRVDAVNSLVVGLNISDNGDEATLDSPQQGAYGIEADVDYNADDSIAVSFPSIGAEYHAKKEGDKLNGLFSQGSMTRKLTLEKGAVSLNRPQTPVAPFPYVQEQVVVENGDITLAGTLTLPDGADAETPVVVMVTGSGLQNRDEEIYHHKPFAVIADYLARNGIASLRCDDRGFGESTGDAEGATTVDFAADARAQVDYLKAVNRFGKVGMLGHSEGGSVALMLGESGALDFIVSIAGPAVRGDSVLIEQNDDILRRSGYPDSVVDDYVAVLRVVYSDINQGKKFPIIPAYVAMLTMSWDKTSRYHLALAANLVRVVEEANKPWLHHFVTWSPDDAISSIECPMLAIYGGCDFQVDAKMNASKIQSVNPAINVKIFDGLNHLMQHSIGGSIDEYGQIEETMSLEVLNEIAGFINGLR